MSRSPTRPVLRLFTLASAAVLGVACSAPGPSAGVAEPPASPAPSPTAAWTTFTSDSYAYSIGHPADWKVIEHTSEWRPSVLIFPRCCGVDTFGTPDDHRHDAIDGAVTIASTQLQAGTTLDDLTETVAGTGNCQPRVDDTETTLDGEPARWLEFSCDEQPFWVQLTALHGGRGYALWFASHRAFGLPRADERPITQQLIDSFRFAD